MSEIKLSDEQLAAVDLATSSRICVITGGPGVGKSTVSKAVVAKLATKGLVLACAPTGRAAKRLSQCIGQTASTIHRVLKFDPGTGSFYHSSADPLKCAAVVVDESSMVDTSLAASLIDAVPARAPVVFVGDYDQLPSVGPGAVFRDLVSCGKVPVARLTRVYRQDPTSRIALNCQAINRGEAPELEGASDTEFFECREDHLPSMVEDLLRTQSRFDPFDVQVLIPQRTGPYGVEIMNDRMQTAINPDQGQGALQHGSRWFRVGDKIMQTKNDYEVPDESGGLGVYNGEIGRVLDVLGNGKDRELRVDYGDRICRYKPAQIGNLDFAFCSTVHKMQGSESPAAILVVSSAHRRMWSRQLLYTAMSRPKQHVWIVGDRAAIDSAVTNTSPQERRTTLCQRISA